MTDWIVHAPPRSTSMHSRRLYHAHGAPAIGLRARKWATQGQGLRTRARYGLVDNAKVAAAEAVAQHERRRIVLGLQRVEDRLEEVEVDDGAERRGRRDDKVVEELHVCLRGLRRCGGDAGQVLESCAAAARPHAWAA
jgi:hypothetical protein